jgi:hypothetical protein
MRQLFYLSLIIVIGCEKMDNTKPQEKPICEHQEFHGTFLLNNNCIKTNSNKFSKEGDDYIISLRKSGIFLEGIRFNFTTGQNLKDTLFLESSFNLKSNQCGVFYTYFEGASVVGSWDIPKGKGTKNDYLIIDEFNSDTTIIGGRFQCKFQTKTINPFVNAPDTLNISCGSFKLKRE